MKSIDKLWDELIQMDEHQQLEAKPGTCITDSVIETICSYSNTSGLNGGYILLGVVEDSKSASKYRVEGVSDSDKLQKDLASQCTSRFSTVVRPEINVGVLEGKTVIAVYVSEVSSSEKPVYIRKLGLEKGTYVRIGSTDQVCTQRELVRLLQEQNSHSYDESIMKNVDVSELDSSAISIYRELRRKKDPDASELEYSDVDLLYSLRCVDKVDGVYHPTVAGVLLFGTSVLLRRCFPMVRFDYVRVRGRDWVGGNDNEIYYSLEFQEPLFTLLPKAEAAIMDDIKREFIFPQGSLIREEIPVVPYKVIREVLVNAVMHRDYRTPSQILVIRYSNRIEFKNPGYSLKPAESLGEPGSSVRNPLISAVFDETKYAENKGSGIAKIQKGLKEAQLPPPLFLSSENENTFLATISLHQLMDGDELIWLTQFSSFNLTSEEAYILVYAKRNKFVSNEVCRNLTGYDTLKSSSLLKKLRTNGILLQHSHGSATYYTLQECYLYQRADGDVMDSLSQSENKGNLGLFTQTLPEVTQSGGENNVNSELFTQTSPEVIRLNNENKVEAQSILSPSLGVSVQSDSEIERINILRSLPSELSSTIQNSGSRLNPELRNKLLICVCSVRPFTSSEISTLFRKTHQWTKQSLRELVLAKKIIMTIPDKPNSRNQAYYVPKKNGQTDIDDWSE